jgi:hypothetical protein
MGVPICIIHFCLGFSMKPTIQVLGYTHQVKVTGFSRIGQVRQLGGVQRGSAEQRAVELISGANKPSVRKQWPT